MASCSSPAGDQFRLTTPAFRIGTTGCHRKTQPLRERFSPTHFQETPILRVLITTLLFAFTWQAPVLLFLGLSGLLGVNLTAPEIPELSGQRTFQQAIPYLILWWLFLRSIILPDPSSRPGLIICGTLLVIVVHYFLIVVSNALIGM